MFRPEFASMISWRCFFATSLGIFAIAGSSFATENGQAIYKQKCLNCHGANGEGSKEYPQALAGDRSIPQLARVIQKTMPSDDPGSLSIADAEKVAAYVHDSFYSKAARERNRPPRLELARLTVPQYRNSVADLINSFRWRPELDDKRGLKGTYFNSLNLRRGKNTIERLDSEIRFDFGTAGPMPGKLEPDEFSIRWEGSLIAPETGPIDFIVKTDHALRLWVNDNKRPLIDGWVKSGSDTEYRGTIYLVAGQIYPLRLEFTRTDKPKKDESKNEPNANRRAATPASILLAWQLPGQSVAIVPSRFLVPVSSPENYVVSTPFPPDDRSLGWERGTSVSKAWDAATTDAALDATAYIAANWVQLAGTAKNPAERKTKLREFCLRFAERAFRRPLTDDLRKLLTEKLLSSALDDETALKRVVLYVLKSPRFLYREVGGTGNDNYDIAARLSFALWDSLPDRWLWEAAAAGRLAKREELLKQAERMMKDPRFEVKLRGFFHHWLHIDTAHEAAKDPKRFPGFDAALLTDLRTSLDLLLDDVIRSEKADYRQLLLTQEIPMNGRLAKFYGASLKPDAPFQNVKFEPAYRSGILTHPFILSTFAYTSESSPIHRGVFIARGLLGIGLRPPPEAVSPIAADLHPSLTTRERTILQTKPANCMTCHGIINPLGFTLENFDAVGRFRDKERNKPIDAVGMYQTKEGTSVSFSNPRQLAEFLANSPEAHASFIEQLLHHLLQQPVRAYGPTRLEELRKVFAAGDFNIRKMALEIAVLGAMTPRSDRTAELPNGKK